MPSSTLVKRPSFASGQDLLKRGPNQNQNLFEVAIFAGSDKLYPVARDLTQSTKDGGDLDIDDDDDQHDLFPYFRGLLILGRVLGLIPISGVLGKSHKRLEFRFLSLPGITSLVCIILLAFNDSLAIIRASGLQKKSILEFAKIIGNPLFSSWGLFIYLYLLCRSHKLIKIFRAWSKSSRTLTYAKTDIHLYRTIIIISVIMFGSAVLENATLHLELFSYFDDINGRSSRLGRESSNSNESIAKTYYLRSHDYWNRYIGYHPVYVPIVFLIQKWILYGWNFMEVFSALMFRALYYKFKGLVELARERLVEPMEEDSVGIYVGSGDDQQAWNNLAKDHSTLCQLLEVMNDFFSPFLFVSYSSNIYFFCIQLLMGLTPKDIEHSIVHKIYAPWSFVHIIARVFLLSFFGAKVNEYAHKIRDVVSHCPVGLYSGQVARLDQLVNGSQKLGFSGLGCFVITMPFMLSILNVIFTIEIVLLQGLAAESTSSNPNAC